MRLAKKLTLKNLNINSHVIHLVIFDNNKILQIKSNCLQLRVYNMHEAFDMYSDIFAINQNYSTHALKKEAESRLIFFTYTVSKIERDGNNLQSVKPLHVALIF